MAKKYITLDVLDDLNKDIFNKIVAKPHKILCKNFDTEEQLVKQLDTMFSQKNYFWRDKSNKWIYYILEDDVFDYSLEVDLDKKTKDLFGSNYNDMSKLSDIQRVELLKDKKNILKRLELIKSKNRDEISDAIVSGTEDTLLLNKVIFDDLKNLSPANAKEKSKEAVAETTEIVKIASNLLSEYSGDVSIFSNIIEKSNGSTVKHMTRVFLLSLDFFQYYNHLINEVGYASNKPMLPKDLMNY
ncbi:MAG: hypothetical protein B6229_10135 [Spirochaetaceae bacterium 4572_7]|nr:MAG: hypothetical protein B6229_10135 [Spirochaetaceae bacterium 4572_7]